MNQQGLPLCSSVERKTVSFLASLQVLPSFKPNICHGWETFLDTPLTEARNQQELKLPLFSLK